MLYQQDIDRQEEEQSHLARELHDVVLNQMNQLLLEAGEKIQTKDFDSRHRQLSDTIRSLIHDLRPPMLNYGLYTAFLELVDDLDQKPHARGRIVFNLLPSQARFDPKVEQHLFRIVQQAFENALTHSKAHEVTLSGSIEQHAINLVITDDGRGFDLEQGTDLSALLAARHFGLVGMHERANLIGAQLALQTKTGQGTRIELHWKQK
jgi:two-component system sensor histidine kinase DegS